MCFGNFDESARILPIPLSHLIGNKCSFCNKNIAGQKDYARQTGKLCNYKTAVHAQNLTGTVAAMPAREDIDFPVSEHLIVELYSR